MRRAPNIDPDPHARAGAFTEQPLQRYPDEPHPDEEAAWKAWWVKKCFAASAVLTEVSLRGVGMYIGKNLRKAMTKYGVESGAIEIYPAPESFIYNVPSSSH